MNHPNDRGDRKAKIMSQSTNGNPDLAALREDLAALKRDVAGLIEHLQAGATESAQSAASHLDDCTHQLCRGIAAEAERQAEAVGRQIEQHPLLCLLVAVGVGYIGGRVLSR